MSKVEPVLIALSGFPNPRTERGHDDANRRRHPRSLNTEDPCDQRPPQPWAPPSQCVPYGARPRAVALEPGREGTDTAGRSRAPAAQGDAPTD